MTVAAPGPESGPENGRLIAGRYRVVEVLGRGGMGMVCRCVDEALGREVAVKELRAFNDASGQELADLRVRMQREARAAARIRHSGVVAVHDVAEEDGRPIIVMELVDGPSLDDVLKEQGVLDPRDTAAIGVQVADALGAAHAAGVLHRDVKPGNVLLERGGRVVLTDFGIATMEDPGDGVTSHLTQSGHLVGSLNFLAPERAQGQEPGPASDIWSLGALLYAAVEGEVPFRRTSAWMTLSAIVSDPLPQPRRAGALTAVLRRLMDKDPAARPDAQHARRQLEAVARYVPVTDAVTTAAPPPRTPSPQPEQQGHSAGSVPFAASVPPAASAVSQGPTRPEPGWRPPPGLGAAPHPAVQPRTAAPSGRLRRRLAITAAGVAVTLAGTGVTWAIVDRPGKSATSPHGVTKPQQVPSGSSLPASAPPSSDNTGAITGPGTVHMCLDVSTNTPTDGNAVQLWDCNGARGQQWTMKADHTVRAFGKCLDIVGNGKANFTKVQLWPCNGVDGQQWIPAAHGALLNPGSGRCLDDPQANTARGTQLQIYDCNHLFPQAWTTPSIP